MPWLAGWQYRVPLTIDGTVPALTGPVSNGIAIVGVPAALKAVCQAAGQDLRFTAADGQTLLDYGIEDWSVAAPVCHVRVPTVSTASTTIYAYGGNALAADAQSRSGVAAGHALYCPFGEYSGNVVDWSSGINGTPVRIDGPSLNVWQGVAGKAGPAIQFDGLKGYLDFGDVCDMGTSHWHLGLWFKTADASGAFVCKSLYGGANNRWFVVQDAGAIWAGLHPSSGGVVYTASVGAITDNTWHRVDAVWDRTSTIRIYIDGALAATGQDISAFAADNIQSTYKFGVAIYNDGSGNFSGNSQLRYSGLFDNLTIRTSVPSADDVRFAAQSFPASTMFAFGALEKAGGGLLFMSRNVGNGLRGLIHTRR